MASEQAGCAKIVAGCQETAVRSSVQLIGCASIQHCLTVSQRRTAIHPDTADNIPFVHSNNWTGLAGCYLSD